MPPKTISPAISAPPAAPSTPELATPDHGGVYVRQADGSLQAIEGGPPAAEPEADPATPGATDEK